MSDPEPEALELMHNASRRNLEASVRAVERLDEKASKLLRVDVLLLGVLATAANVGLPVFRTGPLAGLSFVGGFLAVAASTVLSGFAYLGGGVRVGVGPFSDSLEDPLTSEAFRRAVVERHDADARANRDRVSETLRAFQAATAALILGILLLGASTAILLLQEA